MSELLGWKGAASLSVQDYKRAKSDTELIEDQTLDDYFRDGEKKSERIRGVLGSAGPFEPDKTHI